MKKKWYLLSCALMMAQGFGADNLFDGGDGVGNLEDIAPAPVKKNGMRLGAVIPGYGYGYDTSGNYRYGYNMDPDPPKTAAQITKETMTAAAPAVKAVAQAAAQSASIASSIAGSIGGGGAMISMGGGISPRSSGGSSGGSGSGSDSSAGGGSEESNSFISYSSSNPFKKMMLFTNDLKKTNHRPNYNTMDRCNLNKQVDGFERFFSISQFKESGVALSTNLEIRSQKQKKTDLAQKSTTRMINGSISLSQMPTKEKKMIWGVMAGWNHFNAKLADQPIKAAGDMGTFSIFNGYMPREWVTLVNVIGGNLVTSSMKRDISDSVTVNSKNRSYGLNYNLLTVWPKLIPTLAGVSITPLIGGGYSWMKSPEFCERGNTNLTITSLKSFSRILSGSVGLNIEKTFFAGKTKVTPNCSYNYTMTRQLGSKETSSMLRQVSTDVIGSTRQKFDRVHSVTSSLDLKPSRHLSLGFFAGYTKSLTQKYHAINGGVKFSWIFGAKEQKAPTKKLRL